MRGFDCQHIVQDSNTYTSQALVEFAANKRTVQQSFQTCSTTTQSILCRCPCIAPMFKSTSPDRRKTSQDTVALVDGMLPTPTHLF